jgi:hypothetical protein
MGVPLVLIDRAVAGLTVDRVADRQHRGRRTAPCAT